MKNWMFSARPGIPLTTSTFRYAGQMVTTFLFNRRKNAGLQPNQVEA